MKVFILAGQSNMQGHASISTFDSLADDPKTAPLLKEMQGPDGKPRCATRSGSHRSAALAMPTRICKRRKAN